MRLKFILPFYSRRPIGGLRVVYEFAGGLAEIGHDVTVVHARALPGTVRPVGFKPRVSGIVDLCAARFGVPWMKVHPRVSMVHVSDIDDSTIGDADAVFATSWQTAAPTAALSPRKGRKHYLVMDFYPYIASREVLESTWKMGFRIATISRWLGELVVRAGVAEVDVSAVSCGVAPVHCLTFPPDKRQPSIAMMYGLGNYKAAHHGLEALGIARSLFGKVPVYLFGANSRRRPAELPDWAEYHALLSDNQINQLFNRSAVFVSSSLAEGFCLPAAEAMASGCAVVATDSGGIRDFAADGRNALLSGPGKPEQLAANIVRCLRDRELRLTLARSGRETISTFTWPAAVRRLESFVRDTLQQS